MNLENQKITILLVEDHQLIRDSWTLMINNHPRLQVIAATGNAEKAVFLSILKRPMVILMDINLGNDSGIDVTKEIRKHTPAAKIIGVSMHSIPAYVKEMFSAGAMGYVTKNSPKEELIEAILEVYQGHKYICREAKDFLTKAKLEEYEEKEGIHRLTRSEIKIIQLIKKGLSSKEIAEQLEVAPRTIEVHRSNILKKLNLKNTAALVDFANQNLL